MLEYWDVISVFLLSTFKFVLGGVPLAVGLGFDFFKAVTVTSAGGFVGVVFFVYLSERLIIAAKKIRAKRQDKKPKEKKIFTKKNKFIISVKTRFGLIGIVALAPVLISIPLGCYLAVRYFKNKNKIISYMIVSVLVWAIISVPVFDYFGDLLL